MDFFSNASSDSCETKFYSFRSFRMWFPLRGSSSIKKYIFHQKKGIYIPKIGLSNTLLFGDLPPNMCYPSSIFFGASIMCIFSSFLQKTPHLKEWHIHPATPTEALGGTKNAWFCNHVPLMSWESNALWQIIWASEFFCMTLVEWSCDLYNYIWVGRL